MRRSFTAQSRRCSPERLRWWRHVVVVAALLGLASCTGETHLLGTSCLPSGTDRELQAAIDAQSRVLLCPRAVITLNAPVILRQGLTLETAHRPLVAADMATITLSSAYLEDDWPLVGSGSRIQIANVRIDGNRRSLGQRQDMEMVHLGPGNDYAITNSTFTDAPGWTHLHIVEGCRGARIVDNVVETANRPHGMSGGNTDGFSISCQNSVIENNEINDISGVGIVYYGGPGTTIRNNRIVLTTTSASSGINVGDATRLDHTGVLIEGNRVIANGTRYFHIGIAAGLHPWAKPAPKRDIRGVTIENNLISGQARYGLAVDGCVDCIVRGNTVQDFRPLAPAPNCPPAAPYIASVTNGHAGGTLQPGYVEGVVDDCLGMPVPN